MQNYTGTSLKEQCVQIHVIYAKNKFHHIINYSSCHFAGCAVWVRNLVSHFGGGT
jgi:hypothetical protein